MGLEADRERFSLSPIARVVAVSVLVMVVIQALPLPWREALRYDREAISGGEAWRLLTAHFVHLGWKHLSLNMAGLVLGTWLFGADRAPGAWLVATLISALACGAGLWLFSPQVSWCVGLSGVLHGLMVVGFGGWLMAGERWAWALLAVVVGKIVWEQLGGHMPWASAMAGGRVITDAHLWGAVGGALYLGGEKLWQRNHRRV
jgi:rhomboid family GlyGly-CTERM serine protease